ncbi:MAG: hypothetical protein CVV27_11570 [Candidatus Melainabacteria bacterium HGW-Melainabacteria-1]|nr:MAG: hypothetical protein CVV27_11570 [Candidatus Melainabacteria bacterium HGW-Melainabacteria-1]
MTQRNFSFSIFFSLLGIGAGLGGVLAGVALSPEQPQQLLQYRGLAIVGGGLIAVLCMSFSLAEVRQTLALLWDVLSGGAVPDREGVLKECVMLATRGRESEGQETKFYREIKPYLSHHLLAAGLDLLISGYSPEMIRNTLETRRDQESLKYQTGIQMLQSLMQAAWMFGLAGGATALLRTQLLSSTELLPMYLSGIAVPITAGLLLALLLFYPLLRQLQMHQREWMNYLEMSICGVLLLQSRHHAHFLETVLKAYLPPLAPVAAPVASGLPAGMPAGAAPVRSSFQAALQHEAEPEQSVEGPEDPGQALSVDELRRFRPVQRHPSQPGSGPAGSGQAGSAPPPTQGPGPQRPGNAGRRR